MSAAYFVVLEDPDPGFHTFVNGNAVAKAAANLNRIARMLGTKTLDDFVSAGLTEYFDDVEEDFHGTVADTHTVWFEADEGLDWATKLAEYVKDNPGEVHDANGVQGELAEYQELFKNASTAKIRWHMEVDF
ncbi:MAG: hypothetical protein OEQ74_02730 [Gammaproteobacteria bacterium]|nr:hypothetical protein [Gammaproteobacteria bacterium]